MSEREQTLAPLVGEGLFGAVMPPATTWLPTLLTWLSPSYPVGGFSYSHGLEWAVESGAVHDRHTLEDYVATILEAGAGWVDLVLLAEAWRTADAPDAVIELAQAWRGTAETALEAAQQGAAIRAATRAEDRVARVVAIGPSGTSGTFNREARLRGAALAGFLRSPLVGEAAYNVLATKGNLRWFLGHQIFADPAFATPDVVNHVYALAHQPGARYVPAALSGGLLDCEPARDLPFLARPLAVLWGERASSLAPISEADDIVHLAEHAELTRFAASGLMPHLEEPDAVARAIEQFALVQTA